MRASGRAVYARLLVGLPLAVISSVVISCATPSSATTLTSVSSGSVGMGSTTSATAAPTSSTRAASSTLASVSVGSTLPSAAGEQDAVVSVTDGDTIEVTINGSRKSVRLIGIDAPESGEDFAAEATAALRELIGGKIVRLEEDADEQDQYGRLLAYVWSGDVFINAEMLRRGWATLYTVPPNVRHRDELLAAENEAKRAQSGCWGSPQNSPLQIVTVHYDAAGPDNNNLNDEYIVFKVLVSGSLRGYSVEDETGHRYDFRDHVLQRGRTFTLHTGEGKDTDADLYWGAFGSAIWNNDGDTVKVLDPKDKIVASQHYGE
jgi:micrococcal nuclease